MSDHELAPMVEKLLPKEMWVRDNQRVVNMMDTLDKIGLGSFDDAERPTVGEPNLQETLAAVRDDPKLVDAMRHVCPGLPAERYQDMVNAYRTHYLAGDQAIELFDGVAEALARWRARGVLLAVATGKSRIGLDRALAATGLGECFAITRTVDECRSKPHPQMLDDITEFLGADKRRTLMVGDTTHDLQMAQNAGTWGAGVSYGAHPVEALRDCAPLACFDSFAEFDTWLTPRLAN